MGAILRSLRKRQTRAAILAAATTEFGKRGIMATRMSDVAEAASVSHGTVFAHFETQEALVGAVIEEFGERIAARTHELASGGGGVREVLAAHLAGLMEFESFYSKLVAEAGLLPLVARNTLVSIQSAISFHLGQAARRGMDAGTIRPMPLHLLFNTWLGLVNYYVINADLFAPGGSALERCGATLLDHYMSLISVDRTEEGGRG